MDAQFFIEKAENSVTLIDNYIDESTLRILGKKAPGVKVKIFTWNMLGQPLRNVKRRKAFAGADFHYIVTKDFHDRYLILDDKRMFLLSTSLRRSGHRGFHITRIYDYGEVKRVLGRARMTELKSGRKTKMLW